jgi:hypothetical protein
LREMPVFDAPEQLLAKVFLEVAERGHERSVNKSLMGRLLVYFWGWSWIVGYIAKKA